MFPRLNASYRRAKFRSLVRGASYDGGTTQMLVSALPRIALVYIDRTRKGAQAALVQPQPLFIVGGIGFRHLPLHSPKLCHVQKSV